MIAPLGAGVALNPGEICDGHCDSLAMLLAEHVMFRNAESFPAASCLRTGSFQSVRNEKWSRERYFIALARKPFSHIAAQRVLSGTHAEPRRLYPKPKLEALHKVRCWVTAPTQEQLDNIHNIDILGTLILGLL